jgi:hypothetical protein
MVSIHERREALLCRSQEVPGSVRKRTWTVASLCLADEQSPRGPPLTRGV